MLSLKDRQPKLQRHSTILPLPVHGTCRLGQGPWRLPRLESMLRTYFYFLSHRAKIGKVHRSISRQNTSRIFAVDMQSAYLNLDFYKRYFF